MQTIFQTGYMILHDMNNEWDFLLLVLLTAIDLWVKTKFSHSDRCTIIFHFVLICFFSMKNYVKLLFICLFSICTFFSVRCLFRYFTHFSIALFTFPYYSILRAYFYHCLWFSLISITRWHDASCFAYCILLPIEPLHINHGYFKTMAENSNTALYSSLVLVVLCLFRLYFSLAFFLWLIISCSKPDTLYQQKNWIKQGFSMRIYISVARSWAIFNVSCSYW